MDKSIVAYQRVEYVVKKDRNVIQVYKRQFVNSITDEILSLMTGNSIYANSKSNHESGEIHLAAFTLINTTESVDHKLRAAAWRENWVYLFGTGVPRAITDFSAPWPELQAEN